MLDFNVKLFILLTFSMVFDWIFQDYWEATNKTTNVLARMSHSIKYACSTGILLILFIDNISISGLELTFIVLAEFITHFWIDKRSIVKWWLRKVKEMPDKYVDLKNKSEVDLGFINAPIIHIGVDQCFHMIVHLIIAVIVTII